MSKTETRQKEYVQPFRRVLCNSNQRLKNVLNIEVKRKPQE
jgi:hypothetical protein